jgi:hypothetical protein
MQASFADVYSIPYIIGISKALRRGLAIYISGNKEKAQA